MIFSIFVIDERDIETTIINPGNPSRIKKTQIMKTSQIVLSILKPRLEDYKKQLKDFTDTVPGNYMKFFELHACDAFKLSYKIECLSVFFEKDKLNDIEVREYLQSGIDFFTKSLLERPLQAGTSNTMHNLSYILKLEAQQELLRLYKQMMGKFDIK